MNSMSKAVSSQARRVSSPEESGWTIYFEDFLNNNREHSSLISADDHESSSLVSDATSSAAKKHADKDQAAGFSMDRSCRKLSFKKRKAKGALVDDAWVDTASSPVYSPKVCDLNQLHKNSTEKYIYEEKGRISGQIEEKSEFGFIGKDSDCTKLKKRGLCLVPLSLLANYLD